MIVIIDLYAAFKLADVEDNDIVYLKNKNASKLDAEMISVKNVKKKYDMRKIKVIHIKPHFYDYSEYDGGIEFEILR